MTGFEYEAWKFGPVPVDLMQEWEMLGDDLSADVDIVPDKVIDYTRETVKPCEGVDFIDEDFTPRQISIMEELAARFRTTRAPTMIDVTHAQNGAWDRVWNDGAGARAVIPYLDFGSDCGRRC
ncbi:MAG: type II toxin-antitoxin system antitoxin SocA domain-containing protein [Duganella sp.]